MKIIKNSLIVSSYGALGSFIGTLTGMYMCKLDPRYSWKELGIWSMLGGFCGIHYATINYFIRKY